MNKYSQYFDTNFNFNNKVEYNKTNQNMICDGNIMLEPRLQQYLKMKKYYKSNNIEPTVPLEKEYSITAADFNIIKAFLGGNKKIYEKKTYEKLVKGSTHKPSFPSSKFKDDKRVPDIEKNKRSLEMPINRGMFMPDSDEEYYESDSEGFDLNNTRFSPRLDPRIDPGREEHNKYDSQFRIPFNPNQKEKCDSRNMSRKYTDQRNKHILTDFDNDGFKGFDNSTSYSSFKKGKNRTYGKDVSELQDSFSEMDFDNKVVIPNNNSKFKKELNSSDYRFETYYGKGKFRDSDLEADLIRGMPSYRPRNKSYGYRNPEENYFDYIDEDFRYDNIEPWERGGICTRASNKSLAKNRKYERTIM